MGIQDIRVPNGAREGDEMRELQPIHIWSVWLVCVLFSAICYFLDARLMCLLLGVVPLFLTPIQFYFVKNGRPAQARWALTISSLIYISFSRLGIGDDVFSEFYLLPTILVVVQTIDSRKKFEAWVNPLLVLGTWAFMKWFPRPEISEYWRPTHLSGDFFRNINFVITFFLVGFFAKRFADRAVHLKNEKEKLSDLLLAQQIKVAQSSKLAAVGEMAAGVAHEINNPLAIIQGKASQLLRSMESAPIEPSKLRTDLEKILATSERIARIIRGLRSMGRDSENDPMLPASCHKIINEPLELCRERLKLNSISLQLQLNQDFELECRATEIEQVLLNLIGNAFDAIQNLPERWIRIQARDRGDSAEILVVDSGSGIPDEIAERMMFPFFTTKEVGKGTGLGLSISMGILRAHGGLLQYRLEGGHTCFVMTLPKRAGPASKRRLNRF